MEGLLQVELETRTARGGAPEPFDCVVAGGRYVYVTPTRVRCVAWPGGARVEATVAGLNGLACAREAEPARRPGRSHRVIAGARYGTLPPIEAVSVFGP